MILWNINIPGTTWKRSAVFSLIVKGLVVFSSVFIMTFTDGFVGEISAESTEYVDEGVNVSPAQDQLQVCGMGAVCQTCWQSVGHLSCTTWAGAQPGLIIGELQCLVSLRMVVIILPYWHVLCWKDKREPKKKVHLLSLNYCSIFSSLQSF